jgi:hypothetical protein
VANAYWSLTRCCCKLQVGWLVHHRYHRLQHDLPVVEPPWRLRVSPRLWIRHFMARALCLIVVPIMFYLFIFEIHFLILANSGEGDGFMSAEFQHTLGGRSMQDTYAGGLPSSVPPASLIRGWDRRRRDRVCGHIRHVNTQGGYLHSHAHNYPGGSGRTSSPSNLLRLSAQVDKFRTTDYAVPSPRFQQRLAHHHSQGQWTPRDRMGR